MFPRLKSALNRRRFCDATDITKNATEELKRLSQNGFLPGMFPTHLKSLSEVYSLKGDYFEEHVAWKITLFCISQIYSASGNILKL
jgi:hypothetical protein